MRACVHVCACACVHVCACVCVAVRYRILVSQNLGSFFFLISVVVKLSLFEGEEGVGGGGKLLIGSAFGYRISSYKLPAIGTNFRVFGAGSCVD